MKMQKNLDVSVGNVIAGSKEEIKKQKKSEYKKIYYQKNKLKIKERVKKWIKNNPDKRKKIVKKYNDKNKENKKNWFLNKYYNDDNYKLQCTLNTKIWIKNNKEQYKKYRRNYDNKRRREDPSFKLRKTLSTRIWHALKNNVKSKKTVELLGCSIDQLWSYLKIKFKPGMTVKNYGEWHVDHIKPCAAFDLTKPEEQQKCFHYTNLQPLWAKENLIKNDKYEETNNLPD